MDKFEDAISFLREQDAGRDGEHARVAECIEQLLGEVWELREQIGLRTPSVPMDETERRQQENAARQYSRRDYQR